MIISYFFIKFIKFQIKSKEKEKREEMGSSSSSPGFLGSSSIISGIISKPVIDLDWCDMENVENAISFYVEKYEDALTKNKEGKIRTIRLKIQSLQSIQRKYEQYQQDKIKENELKRRYSSLLFKSRICPVCLESCMSKCSWCHGSNSDIYSIPCPRCIDGFRPCPHCKGSGLNGEHEFRETTRLASKDKTTLK
mgnify:CR=1 FL=1|jgi:hypothetical protein